MQQRLAVYLGVVGRFGPDCYGYFFLVDQFGSRCEVDALHGVLRRFE